MTDVDPADGQRRLETLLADCVHCGFCLSSCPSYDVLGTEMDSPRGRIELMRELADGGDLSASVVGHIDSCLGCLACVPACPSGVRYDVLIESSREQIESGYARSRRGRVARAAIFAVFPYRRRTAPLRGPLWLYQRSGLSTALRRSGVLRRLPAALRMLEAIAPPVRKRPRLPAFLPAQGPRRAVVGLLTGCVQATFFAHVNASTARVLTAEGCDVYVPPGQGCCGALSAHSGRTAEAARMARRLIDVLDAVEVDAIVVNAAGCGSAMKHYASLLQDDPLYAERAAALAGRTRDLAEFLYDLGPVAVRHPLELTVAYHDACHLSNAQGITAQPRKLLAGIPGLTLAEVPDGQICCGSAGVYNLLQPETAAELGRRKADNIRSTGADLVVSANPGCLMQISGALAATRPSPGSAHTVEVLDASIRGVPAATFLEHSP